MDGTRAVLAALGSVPDRLAIAPRIVNREPPSPGEWTPSDVVRHLIAVEREVWQPRLAQLATEDHPIWAWAEPDRWTDKPGAPLQRLVEVYRDARASTVDILAALGDDGWARIGSHSTFGEVDVAGLMSRAVEHDEEHLHSLER